MAKGFKFLKNEEVITVRDFRQWNKDAKEFNVRKGLTSFACVNKDEQLYAESLGTVVELRDGEEVAVGALVWFNDETPKDKSE